MRTKPWPSIGDAVATVTSLDCPACRGIGGDGILQPSVAHEGRTVCNSCGRYFTRTGAALTAEEAVALMPQAVRQAFTLRKVYEFDHDEIARRICLPLADIEQLLIQAARFLPVAGGDPADHSDRRGR